MVVLTRAARGVNRLPKRPLMPSGNTGPSGASTSNLIMAVPSGQYFSQANNGSALVTIAAAANRMDFMPFIPARDVAINEIAVEVTTAVLLSAARIGIYSDANGSPFSLLCDSGLLDCATVGAKASAVSITLSGGQTYWLAVLSSLAQTYRGVPVAAMPVLSEPATGTAVNTLRRATQVFGAMPTTAPVSVPTSAIGPRFRMRVA